MAAVHNARMNPPDFDITAVVCDPTWFPHRYDPLSDAIHFRRLSRDDQRAATFLTDEEMGSTDPLVLLREPAIAATGASAPLHFILHSAFCCSTLLARALDIEGVAMGLKEPVILNDLVGWRHRGGDNAQVARALDGALTLLARPFGEGEAVIVKPSNIVNVLAPLMLAMRPQSCAVLLYCPLRNYLASIAKKGMWGRLWVRDLLVKQLKDGLIDLGFTPEDHLGQTDLQVAAIGWLVQQALFGRLIEHYGSQRVRAMDSETLVARPRQALGAVASFYGLTIDSEMVARVVAGPAFNRHSKFGEAFGKAERAAEHNEAANVHRDEIEKVAIWAEAVAKAAGVSIMLDAPLVA